MILAAGSGDLSIPPVALLILAAVIYFIGRAHGKG